MKKITPEQRLIELIGEYDIIISNSQCNFIINIYTDKKISLIIVEKGRYRLSSYAFNFRLMEEYYLEYSKTEYIISNMINNLFGSYKTKMEWND